jgi:hypothetical protein
MPVRAVVRRPKDQKEKAAAPAASVPCFDSGIRGIDRGQVKLFGPVKPAGRNYSTACANSGHFRQLIDFIEFICRDSSRAV